MFAKRNSAVQNSAAIMMFGIVLALVFVLVSSYPTSISSFAHVKNLDQKIAANEDTAERQSFQQFIRSKPGSTVLGELKPNASAKEVALLRDKIAKTIRSLEALDSISAELKDLEPMTNNECFIEVTKVERITGKCNKVNGKIPVCQSKNFMAFNNECM